MTSSKMQPPAQACINTWAPRVRTYGNALITPVIEKTTLNTLSVRTTKRGTTAINYAEDGYDDDDFDDSEGPRRLTGLRSRQDPGQERTVAANKLGQEVFGPVKVQGIQRAWLERYRASKATLVPVTASG